MITMTKIADTSGLLDPEAAGWKSIGATTLTLIPTPIGNQPTPYTKTAWKDRPMGMVTTADVRACHDGETVFLRLSWQDISENREIEDADVFPDAAGVLWPINTEAAINTMGAEHQGVNAWQWKANEDGGRSVSAFGTGSSEPNGDSMQVQGLRGASGWDVVISRKLVAEGPPEHSVKLAPGTAIRVGVAIWEGSNGERAGYKSFTENWIDVDIQAA